MKILLDFSSIKSGGGLQLATNFLSKLKDKDLFIILANKNISLPDDYKEKIRTPKNIIIRYIYENTILRSKVKKIKPSVIFTFFGPGLPSINNTISIKTVAYPIICYPESPYWSNIPHTEKYKKKVLNFFRANRLNKSDQIICETPVMQRRLEKTLKKNKKYHIVPPAASDFISEKSIEERLEIINQNKPKILILSGVAYHKNIHMAYNACINNLSEFIFMISVTREDFCTLLNKKGIKVQHKILDERFEFKGCIPSDEIGYLYNTCDALINLSDLESFSNNYLEAWKTSLPLLCSDRDFSREICKESAIYFEPHSSQSIRKAIDQFKKKKFISLKEMLSNGKLLLAQTPTTEQRILLLEKIIFDSLKCESHD